MTVYTPFALIFGVLIGGVVGYYHFKKKNKKAIEKAIKENSSKGFNTLKSEGDDQPKKETELPREGKEDVLEQPAVSSNVPPVPKKIEEVIEPITQIEAEVKSLSEEKIVETTLVPEVEKIRKEAEDKIKQLETDKLKAAKDIEIKRLKKKEAEMIKKIKKEMAEQIMEVQE